MIAMSALEVRKKFGSVLDMVAKQRVAVAISRSNKPLAVLIPADEYQAAHLERERRIRLTIERIEEWKRSQSGRLKGVNAVQLLRESREGR